MWKATFPKEDFILLENSGFFLQVVQIILTGIRVWSTIPSWINHSMFYALFIHIINYVFTQNYSIIPICGMCNYNLYMTKLVRFYIIDIGSQHAMHIQIKLFFHFSCHPQVMQKPHTLINFNNFFRQQMIHDHPLIG